MKKFILYLSVILAVSFISSAFISSRNHDPVIKHTVTTVANPNAGHYRMQCTTANYDGIHTWQYAVWESWTTGQYTVAGCSGVSTNEVGPACDGCPVGHQICGNCPIPNLYEPKIWDVHTVTIDDISGMDAKEYGRAMNESYPNASDIEVKVQNNSAIITFKTPGK